MAHKLGDSSKIGFAHDQPAGESVPKVVQGEVGEPGFTNRILEPVTRPSKSVTLVATGKFRALSAGAPA